MSVGWHCHSAPGKAATTPPGALKNSNTCCADGDQLCCFLVSHLANQEKEGPVYGQLLQLKCKKSGTLLLHRSWCHFCFYQCLYYSKKTPGNSTSQNYVSHHSVFIELQNDYSDRITFFSTCLQSITNVKLLTFPFWKKKPVAFVVIPIRTVSVRNDDAFSVLICKTNISKIVGGFHFVKENWRFA